MPGGLFRCPGVASGHSPRTVGRLAVCTPSMAVCGPRISRAVDRRVVPRLTGALTLCREQGAHRILRLAEEADGGPEGTTAPARLLEKMVGASDGCSRPAARLLRTADHEVVNYAGLSASWVISRVTRAADVPSPVGPLMCQGVP